MSYDVPEAARWWGVGPAEMELLYCSAWWLHDKPLTFDDRELRISTHKAPKLPDIYGDRWGGEYEAAVINLQKSGLFKDENICNNKVRYAPTGEGLKAMRELLDDRAEDLRPEWAKPWEDGPIYGDPDLFWHAKGVHMMARMLDQSLFSFNEDVTRYPNTSDLPGRPDVKAEHESEYARPCYVEVVTVHQTLDQFMDKLEWLCETDADVWWVFERREWAANFFNQGHQRGRIDLDGGQFGGDDLVNNSIQTINRKLWRSDLHIRADTIPSILHCDNDDFDARWKAYLSNRQLD